MKKYIAHIIIETTTPLVVGSGKSALDNDAIVAKDWNFLPYIPGTGILGVISSLFKEEYNSDKHFKIFGGEEESTKKDTFNGAIFEISDALLIDYDDKNNYGNVHQQLVQQSTLSKYHKKFLKLQKREHVRINDRGTTNKGAKFDNEFVHKGARFKFEIELQGGEEDEKYWKSILNSFSSSDFFLGSGTTNGYGQIKVIEIKTKTFDLSEKEDFEKYLNHTVDLNSFEGAKEFKKEEKEEKWKKATLKLETNAIHIGAGYGDSDVDDANYKEYAIDWDVNNKPTTNKYFVIPGTSIKGAVSHRLAFHSNIVNEIIIENIIKNLETTEIKKAKKLIDISFENINRQKDEIQTLKTAIAKIEENNTEKKQKLEALKEKINILKTDINNISYQVNNDLKIDFSPFIGEQNTGVNEMFGTASNEKIKNGSIGNIIFNDIYIPENKVSETIFQHNSIDRFTSGTLDTALFSEKVFKPTETLNLEYFVYNKLDKAILTQVLIELGSTELAIGGKTTKGYGYFKQKND